MLCLKICHWMQFTLYVIIAKINFELYFYDLLK